MQAAHRFVWGGGITFRAARHPPVPHWESSLFIMAASIEAACGREYLSKLILRIGSRLAAESVPTVKSSFVMNVVRLKN